MRPADLKMRCYLEPQRDGLWFAVCIDLNLSAIGDSQDQAKHKLHDQIRDYIEEALTDDSAFFSDLVPRPAPFSRRLKYHIIELLCRLRDNTPRNRACHFTDFLPLKPA